MILNYEQVRQKNIFSGSVEENFNNAVYDIRIGKIITMNGDEVTEYKIPPQGMVVVVSTEEVTMPPDAIGYAHVRTSLSSKGIMAINIGIIDPGYSGNLSSTLLNFGKEDFPIAIGERFLRTTFHHIATPVDVSKLTSGKGKSLDYDHYMDKKKVEALKYMDEKFMSFDKEVSKSINKRFDSIRNYAASASLVVGTTAFTVALTVFLLNYIFNIFKGSSTEGYEYQLKINQAKYELLEREHRSLQTRLDSIIKHPATQIALPKNIPHSTSGAITNTH